MKNLQQIADDADVIIDGFAFERIPEGIRVFDLNSGTNAALFQYDGTLIETNMSDIELEIASRYYQRAIPYIDSKNAENYAKIFSL